MTKNIVLFCFSHFSLYFSYFSFFLSLKIWMKMKVNEPESQNKTCVECNGKLSTSWKWIVCFFLHKLVFYSWSTSLPPSITIYWIHHREVQWCTTNLLTLAPTSTQKKMSFPVLGMTHSFKVTLKDKQGTSNHCGVYFTLPVYRMFLILLVCQNGLIWFIFPANVSILSWKKTRET